MTRLRVPLAIAALAMLTPALRADPTLSLTTNHGLAPLLAGDTFEVTLRMSDLSGQLVAGCVAFVEFDSFEVDFVGGSYTNAPFGLHLIDPITAAGGVIALAAGIDIPGGQAPTSQDATLATLVFESHGGCVTSVGFADSQPPTTLTDPVGQPVTPLMLVDLPPLPTARMALTADYGSAPVEPGDFIVISLALSVCDGSEVAGFQAFLEYDDAQLTFISGTYNLMPFAQPIIWPITAQGPQINLAAGIDVAQGQPPVNVPVELATLTFMTNTGGCEAPVWFRMNDPPSRLTNPVGDAVEPLSLDDPLGSVCLADIVLDCVVDVRDLLALLAAWGAPGGPADVNGDGIVDVEDLLIVLAEWGPCI